jgi:hypothetical protein
LLAVSPEATQGFVVVYLLRAVRIVDVKASAIAILHRSSGS